MSTYYHGGHPGLWPGQQILPPATTGTRTVHHTHAPADVAAIIDRQYRPDRVYLTTDREQAAMYAALYPTRTGNGGAVYRVRPDGDIEDDPDWLGEEGGSVHAPAATILGVVHLAVDPRPYLAALMQEARTDG